MARWPSHSSGVSPLEKFLNRSAGSEGLVSLRREMGAARTPAIVPLAAGADAETLPLVPAPDVDNEVRRGPQSAMSEPVAATQPPVSPTESQDTSAATEPSSEQTPEQVIAKPAEVESAIALAEVNQEIDKAPTSAAEDPAFQAVVTRAKGVAKQQKAHGPAQTEAQKAQSAAEPPANEVASKAQDRQVQEMAKQQPGVFNADAFIKSLLDKIATIVPQNEKAAEKFKTNNKLGSVKQTVSAQVAQEKQQAADPIAKKNKATPNTSGIRPKSVKPLAAKDAGPKPVDIKANLAAPKAKTAAEVSQPLAKNSQQLDQQMVAAEVTDEQLAKSNEPQFTGALAAKQETQTHAKTGPNLYRKTEGMLLAQAQTQAQETGQAKVAGMHGQRDKALGTVLGQQKQAKGKDEQARAKVATDINGLYETTKSAVTTLLTGLDVEVNKQFDAGAKVATKEFEAYVGPGDGGL